MELKTKIEQRLQNFHPLELRPAALGLLNTLGYSSEKTIKLGGLAGVSELEMEIDQFVYQFYDLTNDEIAIVEGQS